MLVICLDQKTIDGLRSERWSRKHSQQSEQSSTHLYHVKLRYNLRAPYFFKGTICQNVSSKTAIA